MFKMSPSLSTNSKDGAIPLPKVLFPYSPNYDNIDITTDDILSYTFNKDITHTTTHNAIYPFDDHPYTSTLNVQSNSPPEVQSTSVPLAESSSNYLPVNGNATPGDRGGGEGIDESSIMGMMEDGSKVVLDVTSSGMKSSTGPRVEPVADLREAKGELNRRSCLQDEETSIGPRVESRLQDKERTSGGNGINGSFIDYDYIYNGGWIWHNRLLIDSPVHYMEYPDDKPVSNLKVNDTVWDIVQRRHRTKSDIDKNRNISYNIENKECNELDDTNNDMQNLIREHYHISEHVLSSQTQPYANAYKKPKSIKWSDEDTIKFYNAVEIFGTDLMLIRAHLPNFTDRQIYDKFKLEERKNPQLLQNALQTYKSISIKPYENQHGKIDTTTHYDPNNDPYLNDDNTNKKITLSLKEPNDIPNNIINNISINDNQNNNNDNNNINDSNSDSKIINLFI